MGEARLGIIALQHIIFSSAASNESSSELCLTTVINKKYDEMCLPLWRCHFFKLCLGKEQDSSFCTAMHKRRWIRMTTDLS